MQDTSVFRYSLYVLFRHKYKVLLMTLTAAALVFGMVSRAQTLYEASASLLVKFGSHAGSQSSGAGTTPDREGRISNEIELLTSHDLMEQVIATSGVGYLYPELVQSSMPTASMVAQATLQFREHLQVERIAGSDVIRVAFQHPQPRVASEVVNLMIQLYEGKHQQTFSSPTAVTFLEHQVQRHNQLMQQAEGELETFKEAYGTHSLKEERTLLLQQRADLVTLQNTLQSETAALEQKLSVMKDQRDTLPEIGPQSRATSSALDQAKARLRGLRRQERNLAKVFKGEHPKLIEMRRQIQTAKAALLKLQERSSSGESGPYQEVESRILQGEADLQGLEARVLASGEQLKQLDQQLLTLTQQEKELNTLQRELSTHEQNYRTAVEKLEASRLTDEVNRHKAANISVIEPAIPPTQPSGLGPDVMIALGVLTGFVTGFLLALISERTNQRLSTPADVERRLGLPVLAAVAEKQVKAISVAGLHVEPHRLLPDQEASSPAV